MDDPYKILGVARDAGPDDIRGAYRKLAKQHHPDLNPGDTKAEERFKLVSAANELLSDPEKRARFDRGEIDSAGQEQAPTSTYRDYAEGASGRSYGRAGPQPTGWDHDDLRDMFGDMFGGGQKAGRDTPLRGRDQRYTLTTPFLDAVIGATRRLALPDGRTLDVRIPPGTTDGQVLRLRGQGSSGWNGGPHGDALIEIDVEPHPYLTRRGQDLRMDLPVSVKEAVLGGPIDVPTPLGTVRMQIPPGSDSGTQLRLKGRGVPKHGDIAAGDLYATLRVTIGTPDAALKDFLSAWEPANPIDPRHDMEAVR